MPRDHVATVVPLHLLLTSAPHLPPCGIRQLGTGHSQRFRGGSARANRAWSGSRCPPARGSRCDRRGDIFASGLTSVRNWPGYMPRRCAARIAGDDDHAPGRLDAIAKGLLPLAVLYQKRLDRDVPIFMDATRLDLVDVNLVPRGVGALEAGSADGNVLFICREDVVHHGARATWAPELERINASHHPGRSGRASQGCGRNEGGLGTRRAGCAGPAP